MISTTKYLRDHPILTTIFYMIVTSIVILAIVFLIIKIYTRQGKEYCMPDLQGVHYSELSHYNDRNYEFVVVDCVYRKDTKDSTVVKQDPRPNMMVKAGRKVYITLSTSSPGNAMVPDLVDETEENAIVKLQNAGFSIGKKTYVESQYRNIVLEMSYKGRPILGGTNLPIDSKIDLTIGNGIVDTISAEDAIVEHNNW